jgi:DeoR/GlpR family transcriptional regulator of sugar metabolism
MVNRMGGIVAKPIVTGSVEPRPRLRKFERQQQILLELKLHPHVRISDLARQFGVSTETLRRDFEALSKEGLISRAYGGATVPARGTYPGLNERTAARTAERERIGRAAAHLVCDGETLMIDSGSTTIQVARSLAYLGTPCTVITNCIPVAMALGDCAAEVILTPGEYQGTESAVVGTETVDFLSRFRVDRCFIGASGLTVEGPFETVRGFAAVKRAMLSQSRHTHLVIDGGKFGRDGLNKVVPLGELSSVIVDTNPKADLLSALTQSRVEVVNADVANQENSMFFREKEHET